MRLKLDFRLPAGRMACHAIRRAFLLPARLKTMGDVIYGHDFKRANQKADRAFWLGPESQAKIDAILAEVRAEQAKADPNQSAE